MIIKTFIQYKNNTYDILIKGHMGTLLRYIWIKFCYFFLMMKWNMRESDLKYIRDAHALFSCGPHTTSYTLAKWSIAYAQQFRF